MNRSHSGSSCNSVGILRAVKRKKRIKVKRCPASTSGVRKRNSTTSRPRSSNAIEQREEEPQNSTHIAIADDPRCMLGSGKTYTGDVFASGSASVVLGDINQLFVINVGSERQIPELLGEIKRVASPYWLLETSSQFRADAYTQESQELTLFSFSGDQVARTKTSQSYLFQMLYRSNPNSLITVALSLKVSIKSKYWHTVGPDSPSRNTSDSLPADLLADVVGWLRRNKSSKRDMYLNGTLEESFKLGVFKGSRDRAMQLQVALRSRLIELTNHLKHWQCPWYDENHLPRRFLHENNRSYYSLVYIPEKRKWACETRFCPGEISFESQIYTLRVLHCLQLRACPGVQRFLGVVRDARDCAVAFLTELPAKGTLVSIMQKGNRIGQPVSRERREKWCRQLLCIVAEIHRQTYAVGMLGLRLAGVFAVDADDSVVLSALLRPMLINHHPYPGSIPPEHRNSKGSVRATPQIDLFQLGLVLWKIAGNKLHERSADFCDSFGCPNGLGTPMACSEPHADPIALEMAAGEYDENLRRIINICRSDDPKNRGTAADLLKMFPGPINTQERSHTTNGTGELLGAEDYQRLYSSGCHVGCDNCGQTCTDHYFHCNICAKNDFDICALCFDSGCHCVDDQHLLHEYRKRIPTRKCFSGVKESGQREVQVSYR